MDQDNATLESEERSSVARRSVLRGAATVAWTVPAVVAMGTTVAAANSLGALDITGQPDYINIANQASFTISGTTPPLGQSQTITVSSGTVNTSVTIAAGATTWSVSGINATNLADGTLTFSASSSLGPLVGGDMTTIVKDTVATVTSPISVSNGAISGTAESGSTSVRVARSTTADPGTWTFVAATLNETGWTRSLSSSNNVTYYGRIEATDARGNKSTYSFSYHFMNNPGSYSPTLTLLGTAAV